MLQSLRHQYRLWKCGWTYPRYLFLQQKRVNNIKWLLKCVKGKCSIFPLHFILLFLSLLLIYANAIPTKYPYLSPRIIWCRMLLAFSTKRKWRRKKNANWAEHFCVIVPLAPETREKAAGAGTSRYIRHSRSTYTWRSLALPENENSQIGFWCLPAYRRVDLDQHFPMAKMTFNTKVIRLLRPLC